PYDSTRNRQHLLVSDYIDTLPIRHPATLYLLLYCLTALPLQRPLPPRRSPDLPAGDRAATDGTPGRERQEGAPVGSSRPGPRTRSKSTRLNSSHVSISYAVFCL